MCIHRAGGRNTFAVYSLRLHQALPQSSFVPVSGAGLSDGPVQAASPSASTAAVAGS